MRRLVSLCLLVLLPAMAWAQGFAAFISPPRFEVKTAAGQPLRQVLEIQHVGRTPGNYRIYTNDWTLDAEHQVAFTNELAPDSCRLWVAIERRELTLQLPLSRREGHWYLTRTLADTDAILRQADAARAAAAPAPAEPADAGEEAAMPPPKP